MPRHIPDWVFVAAIATLVAVLLLYGCGAAGTSSGAVDRTAASDRAAAALSHSPGGRRHCSHARKGLSWYRSVTARWYRQTGARTPTTSADLRMGSHWSSACHRIRYLAKRERLRARVARLVYEDWFRQTYAKWRCVHEREGRWDDPHAPYWGGLQFSWDFMAAYGPEHLRRWGTADRWPIWAQLVTAERGHRARGWSPWPTTARDCGLL